MDVLLEFDLENDYCVVIDEDDDVCYAYLKRKDEGVSHVWLYNRGETPLTPPWKEPGEPRPVKNSAEYVSEEAFSPPSEEDAFSVSLHTKPDRSSFYVDILIGGVCYGRLAPGVTPGWARLAKASNPLASPLPQDGSR